MISTFPYSKVKEGSAVSLSHCRSVKGSQTWNEWSWKACNMSYLMELTELIAVKIDCHSLIKLDMKQGYVHYENVLFTQYDYDAGSQRWWCSSMRSSDTWLLQVLVNRQIWDIVFLTIKGSVMLYCQCKWAIFSSSHYLACGTTELHPANSWETVPCLKLLQKYCTI